jgi:hypothetical protein
MIYSSYTFQDYYSAVSALQAYFLPTHGNQEASVLGKLPYIAEERGGWNASFCCECSCICTVFGSTKMYECMSVCVLVVGQTAVLCHCRCGVGR